MYPYTPLFYSTGITFQNESSSYSRPNNFRGHTLFTFQKLSSFHQFLSCNFAVVTSLTLLCILLCNRSSARLLQYVLLFMYSTSYTLQNTLEYVFNLLYMSVTLFKYTSAPLQQSLLQCMYSTCCILLGQHVLLCMYSTCCICIVACHLPRGSIVRWREDIHFSNTLLHLCSSMYFCASCNQPVVCV